MQNRWEDRVGCPGILISLFVVLVVLVFMGHLDADEPTSDGIGLRAEALLVVPSHYPALRVWVNNDQAQAFSGHLSLELPEGWTTNPAEHSVNLESGASQRYSFTVQHGKNHSENRYPVTMVLHEDDGRTIRADQLVSAATAPYFKVTIDAQIDDWDDAVPVEMMTDGKKTTVATLWNRRTFSVLVAVEEDRLLTDSIDDHDKPGSVDAVQLSIGPVPSSTLNSGESPSSDEMLKSRQLLIVAKPVNQPIDAKDSLSLLNAVCYDLDDDCSLLEDVAVAVRRDADVGVTYYELSIPFRTVLSAIQPSEGREFRFSMLVHDPDGVGLRDLGARFGTPKALTPDESWTQWKGDSLEGEKPRSRRQPWGMCSSKY